MLGQALAIDPEIEGLTSDSRAVKPGDLFAALPGGRVDGRAFIGDAIARGAVAVLAPLGTEIDAGRAVLVTDGNPRRRFALMAALFYGRQPRMMAAVTGTNGKTSVANFTRQIWRQLGHQAASFGTIGLVSPSRVETGSLTTPDPVTLHRMLAELVDEGVTHAAFEASSHGLDQYRLDGVALSAAAFTNLTRDHLDYHGTMTGYWHAKCRLFAEILPNWGVAVINGDSDYAEELAALCKSRGQRLLRVGRARGDIAIMAVAPSASGQIVDLRVEGRSYRVPLPLAGDFQVENAACALGLAIATGADPANAVEALAVLEGVPGRLQHVATNRAGAAIYVDYAHTPDGLETALKALRPHTERRLLVAFGCGGDRDRGKRPLMGEIAARLADRVIVTDDNPRSEDPAAIRAQILAACPGAREIGDRHQAVRAVIAEAGPGDVVMLAGKGHESGQIVGDKTLPFDDAEEARLAVVEAS
jgi:UDP-N-acetylmuramoyl-L-alanyl-D-glutamate--2,6-diaminopimelate ligase